MTPRETALNDERLDWMERAVEAEVAVRELLAYLQMPKFQGAENDFVHVSTDLFPKLREIHANLAVARNDIEHWSHRVGKHVSS